MSSLPRSRLLLLPRELRDHILTYVVHPAHSRKILETGYTSYKFSLTVLRVNRQIYQEAEYLYRKFNQFVSVATPWPEAEQHVAWEGFVPLLIPGGPEAQRFEQETVRVEIEAPEHRMPEQAARKFILHSDDVAKFAEMWYYSDLTHPGLNQHLQLRLQVRDFRSGSGSNGGTAQVPKAIQQRLLGAFGRVKGLFQVEITGANGVQVYPSVEAALRKEMAIPHKLAENCLEEATVLKDEGNAALAQGSFAEALAKYIAAFHAIHIVIDGRRRSVWGDAFFHREMTSGKFKGEHGQVVRVMLRVKLVANVVHTFLKMRQWYDAKFWGMRSIDIIEQQMEGEGRNEWENAWPDIIPRAELGKIYYRTAVAHKKLNQQKLAYILLQKAVRYLPNDKIVKNELEDTGVEIASFEI